MQCAVAPRASVHLGGEPARHRRRPSRPSHARPDLAQAPVSVVAQVARISAAVAFGTPVEDVTQFDVAGTCSAAEPAPLNGHARNGGLTWTPPGGHLGLVTPWEKAEPGLVLYNELIRAGRLEQSLELLESLNACGLLNRDDIFHKRFFDECKKRRAADLAFQFFNLLLQASPSTTISSTSSATITSSAATTPVNGASLAPAVSYGTQAKSHVNGHIHSVNGSSTLPKRKSSSSPPFPSLSTLNQLLSVCAVAGDIEGARRAFQLAQTHGLTPDCALYTTLISAHCRAKKLDAAFKIFHEMEAAGVSPSITTFGVLIDGCAKANMVAKAFGIYGIMSGRSIRPDSIIFHSLISACSRAGALDRAFDVLEDMREEERKLEKEEREVEERREKEEAARWPGGKSSMKRRSGRGRRKSKGPRLMNHVTMGTIVDACARNGDMERALSVYAEMVSLGIRATLPVYTAAVHACKASGSLEAALRIYEDMGAAGVAPDEIFFAALINVASASHRPGSAFALLREMAQAGVPGGEATHGALMRMCKKLELKGQALEFLGEIKGSNLAPSLPMYNTLLQTLCDADDISGALSLVEEMAAANKGPNRASYSMLLQACARCDNADVALQLFHRAQMGGIRVGLSIAEPMIDLCHGRMRANASGPNFSFLMPHIGHDYGLPPPKETWASCALTIYHLAISCGVIPTKRLLGKMVAFFRLPERPKLPAPPSFSTPASSSPAPTPLLLLSDDDTFFPTPHFPIHGDQQQESLLPSTSPSSRFPPGLSPYQSRAIEGTSPAAVSSSSSSLHSFSLFQPSFPPLSTPHPPATSNSNSPFGFSFDERQSAALPDHFFEPHAFAVFQEASILGAVPQLFSASGPVTLDVRSYSPFLAELAMLMLLNGLRIRRQSAPGLKLFPITITLPVEKQEVKMAASKNGSKAKTISVSARSGRVIIALLNQMELPFSGYGSSGKIVITASALLKWLQLLPALPLRQQPSTNGTSIPDVSSLLASMAGSAYSNADGAASPRRLAMGISEQQRAIRMGF